MSRPTPKASTRILVVADNVASQALSRQQVFQELDILKPSLIIHSSKWRTADYLKQYIRERKITGMEFDTLQQSTLTTSMPSLMVIFPGNPKNTGDAVAAARRHKCHVLLIAPRNPNVVGRPPSGTASAPSTRPIAHAGR